ncbi:MAG: hypothetical protein IJC11_01565 [Alphaproteobacteria bacterium]|nr:hypothetical protein [Alphaproteobacteria bacterium]MBQ6854666.1 hypothetical protein [Alphaproteobacteria bacterium]MBQ8557667.1 hypothetical protein [Alphaproteobacteria bacterium]
MISRFWIMLVLLLCLGIIFLFVPIGEEIQQDFLNVNDANLPSAEK